MTDELKIKINFLLADFQSLKAEITRRSNAQKAALAALALFYTWFLNNLIAPESLNVLHVFAVWTVTFLVYIFYKREDFEIDRLGSLIKTKISETVSVDIDVPSEKIIPSEVFNHDIEYDSKTKLLGWCFSISLFIVLPSILTLIIIVGNILNIITKLISLL